MTMSINKDDFAFLCALREELRLWRRAECNEDLSIRYWEAERNVYNSQIVTFEEGRIAALNLRFQSRLISLPAEIGRLKTLKNLDLRNCKNLKCLPSEIGALQELERLPLWHCKRLTTLPASVGKLRKLEWLALLCCENLLSLPSEIGQLKNLKTLYLSHCKKLRTLPAELGKLESLEYLYLSNCINLKKLPVELGRLKSLQSLKLDNCPKLTFPPVEKLDEYIDGLEFLKNYKLMQDGRSIVGMLLEKAQTNSPSNPVWLALSEFCVRPDNALRLKEAVQMNPELLVIENSKRETVGDFSSRACSDAMMEGLVLSIKELMRRKEIEASMDSQHRG